MRYFSEDTQKSWIYKEKDPEFGYKMQENWCENLL